MAATEPESKPEAEKGLPPVALVKFDNASRLIPSKYSVGGGSVLKRIAPRADLLDAAFDADNATNDRILAEHQLLPGIGAHELVVDVPYASIINAAFTHAAPGGSRFNSSERGAWYAAKSVRTSQAEVVFHHTRYLAEINRFEDELSYDEYLADFRGPFHDLRAGGFDECLDPGSYMASQFLAERLLASGSLGILYPSVRHAGGECVACFRPALVSNVRKNRTFQIAWHGGPKPTIRTFKP